MWIFKVGVVGAGAMGGGIAQVVTYSGLPVVIKDIVQEQLDLARRYVGGDLSKLGLIKAKWLLGKFKKSWG